MCVPTYRAGVSTNFPQCYCYRWVLLRHTADDDDDDDVDMISYRGLLLSLSPLSPPPTHSLSVRKINRKKIKNFHLSIKWKRRGNFFLLKIEKKLNEPSDNRLN